MTDYDAWDAALGRIIRGDQVLSAEVKTCVRLIEAVEGDDDIAHSREDSLRGAVLEAIAEGRCVDAGDCADAALETSGLKFRRWYS